MNGKLISLVFLLSRTIFLCYLFFKVDSYTVSSYTLFSFTVVSKRNPDLVLVTLCWPVLEDNTMLFHIKLFYYFINLYFFQVKLRYKWHTVLLSLRCTAFDVLQLLSHIGLLATLWIAAYQTSLSFTIFQSMLKFTFVEWMMPSKDPIPCHPLFLLPSVFLSIKVFSKE